MSVFLVIITLTIYSFFCEGKEGEEDRIKNVKMLESF